MCGITGFLGGGGSSDEMVRLLDSMTKSLSHRGPDDKGYWHDSCMAIGLGHARLSIQDLSSAGRQPMTSKCGRFILVFNGEIYNHLDLRNELTDAWCGHSDTETILACFSSWGIESTLKKIVGMFALALWDRDSSTLTLARDRVGEKPLYYGIHNGVLIFGSELRSLKLHPKSNWKINGLALQSYLKYKYVPTPLSIYDDTYKLQPGTYKQFKVSESRSVFALTTEPVKYWSIDEVASFGVLNQFRGSDVEAIDLLQGYINISVQRQLISDVPVGCLLSGGVDSSTIAAVMQSKTDKPISTFTIGFGEHGYDESGAARKIANYLGTDHTELMLTGNDVISLIPEISKVYDEPFADSSQIPTCVVMNLAKQKVSVALSGDGGDELFGGYNRYQYIPKVWSYIRWMPDSLKVRFSDLLMYLSDSYAIKVLAGKISDPLLGEKLFKLGDKTRLAQNIYDFYEATVSEWKNPSDALINHAYTPLLDQKINGVTEGMDILSYMMLTDIKKYLCDDILVKNDRAAMAVSLETRMPFLDPDVISFAWTLPKEMKIRDGRGKWLLRNLLSKYLPNELISGSKTGFAVPLDMWLRGPLFDWADALLSEEKINFSGVFDAKVVRQKWSRHVLGLEFNAQKLWPILMFQVWYEGNN